MDFYKVSILSLFFLLNFLVVSGAFFPIPIIDSISIMTPEVVRYEKFEAKLEITAAYKNGYDYDDIVVGAYFMSPSGTIDSIDGFFMQDYDLNENNGLLISTGNGEFRVRYAPRELGEYDLVFFVQDSTGTIESDAYFFSCIENFNDRNQGFVRTDSNSNYLKFDEGKSYIPIGENIAWQDNNPYIDYRNWLTKLADNGGNFFRLWHAAWGLGIEWKDGQGYEGLRRYKQTNSAYQDWLYDFCAEKGIYVMLAIHYHGAVSTTTNPNWRDSPYNVANGGPCQNTIDFFTNEEAKAHTKNRLRYIVARWGYARNIMSWELFNEVLWTDNYQVNKDSIAEWHFEMANYLKTIDPNQHLVTTSYGEDWKQDEQVWAAPEIDFTQSHIYKESPNLEEHLGITNRLFLEKFEKPTLNGEFGLRTNGSLTSSDPDGIYIHNAIWGSLFSGGMGTAMSWWWESYIHPQDLYFHFLGIKSLVDLVDFGGKNLRAEEAYVLTNSDDKRDLSIQPVLNWGSIGTDSIEISPGGATVPILVQLSEFLYGSVWNTQFRNPPVFSVNYTEEAEFVVTTGSEAGFNPIIEIWVDGAMVLQDSAIINTVYAVTIPEGDHIITVDNKGTDWIKIDSYLFEGLDASMSAYVLSSEEKNYAAGWVLQKDYNHEFIAENGLPDFVSDATLVIEDISDGTYTSYFYDPLTGEELSSGDMAISENEKLELPLPPLVWDVAFIIEKSPVSLNKTTETLAFSAYPNPISSGQNINIQLADDSPFRMTLVDLLGRVLYDKMINNNQEISLPLGLPEGHYWLKIQQGMELGIQSLVLVRPN